MIDPVEETLREWRSGAFVYGQSDCMLSIGKYLARIGHRDVTGQFVGKYDDAIGAAAQMAAHGGVAGLMELAGAVASANPPTRGDVIEVIYRDEEGESGIGGICTGSAVALRLDRGMVELSIRLIKYRGVWHGGC